MKNNHILSVENLSKKFCRDLKKSLLYGIQDIGSELLGRKKDSRKLRNKEFWALDSINFTVKQGEALGLIGSNGAGKSTLLRIISGLIKPDAGKVVVRGRVAPLIALGAGFNPILTGRENIFINMSILGISHKEIKKHIDEVVDFAEIGHALDSPIQSYSSGMAARLGFACAVHTRPDILLIDEVLAVGDVKFRMKCYRKLANLKEEGTAFILVSHSSQSILTICPSSIYLKQGRLISEGNSSTVMSLYEKDLFNTSTESITQKLDKKPESNLLETREISFEDLNHTKLTKLESGKPLFICIKFYSHQSFRSVGVKIIIRELADENNYELTLDSIFDNFTFDVEPGLNELKIHLPYLALKQGLFNLKMSFNQQGIYILDAVESFRFTVISNDNLNCSFYQPRNWILNNNEIRKAQ